MFCDDLIGWTYSLECEFCGARITSLADIDDAIRKWNTRPAEDAKDKEIERLKAALSDMCEMWSAIGKQIPPFLVEQKYLNATAVLVNAPDTNAGRAEESR
jgi:hypothetical protein